MRRHSPVGMTPYIVHHYVGTVPYAPGEQEAGAWTTITTPRIPHEMVSLDVPASATRVHISRSNGPEPAIQLTWEVLAGEPEAER